MAMAISTILLALIGTATALYVVPPQDERAPSVSVIMDGNGGMMRREEGGDRKSASSLLAIEASSQASSLTKRDQYVLTGEALCDGGGLWKRYELNAVTPAKYAYCADACDEKDECVGFDSGATGCNLYTQKAVAVGTWPNVKFSGVAAFAGVGDHDAYPKTPLELIPGAASPGYKCYRKTSYKPVDSYYRSIGEGTCSAGTTSAAYTIPTGSLSVCEDACNTRDECIGFDVGTASSANATAACFLYTQKKVHRLTEEWPGVQAVAGHDDNFLLTPEGLSLALDTGGTAECYVKTHWVSVSSYYMEVGTELCTGDGGDWKHYKMPSGTVNGCKDACDARGECVGLDFAGSECRLYTSEAVADVDSWAGVTTNAGSAFSGQNHHDRFAPNPFSLSPASPSTNAGAKCMVKTHHTD